jgi:hypothetical protein
MIRTP